MSEILLINLSGTNVLCGKIVIPPGSSKIENTAQFRSWWNDGINPAIADKTSCHVATIGEAPVVESVSTVEGNFSMFSYGFAFIFIIGLTSLAARWVRGILGGGLNE